VLNRFDGPNEELYWLLALTLRYADPEGLRTGDAVASPTPAARNNQ
jgi:hypothetical protein